MIKQIADYVCSYNKIIVHEYNFEHCKLNCENSFGVSFELFHMNDLVLLENTLNKMEFLSEFSTDQVLDRVNSGNYLYIAKHKGEIIGFIWFAVKNGWIPSFHGEMELKPHEVYEYNGYVHRGYRGKNILNMIKAHAFRDLLSMGYRSSIGVVFVWNRSSLRIHEKIGSVTTGSISFGYVLGLRFLKSTVKHNKIVSHLGPFYLWGKLYEKIRCR